jgi:hypothetical protein
MQAHWTLYIDDHVIKNAVERISCGLCVCNEMSESSSTVASIRMSSLKKTQILSEWSILTS